MIVTEATLMTDKLLAIARLALSLIPETEFDGLEAEWFATPVDRKSK